MNEIPESEKWLYQGDSLSKLDKMLEWAKNNEPQDNFDELIASLGRS